MNEHEDTTIWTTEDDRKHMYDGLFEYNGSLKLKINELLFETLPPETTLEQLDKIAMDVYSAIHERWMIKP